MFSSIPLSVVFTVAFVVTGAYALVRFALVTADGGRGGDRLAELSHLLMSVAMLAMTWGAGTGPLARALQIAVFGGFGLWFLARAALGAAGHRLPAADHAGTAAAMVWMVAAMPLIMGMPMTDGGSSGHAGHSGHGSGAAAGAEMPGMAAPAPGWVVAVTVAFAALLAAGALFWAVRAGRGAAEPARETPEPDEGCGGVAVRTRPAAARRGLAVLTGPRQDALCHLLMSVGMAAMLLAML